MLLLIHITDTTVHLWLMVNGIKVFTWVSNRWAYATQNEVWIQLWGRFSGFTLISHCGSPFWVQKKGHTISFGPQSNLSEIIPPQDRSVQYFHLTFTLSPRLIRGCLEGPGTLLFYKTAKNEGKRTTSRLHYNRKWVD